MAQGHRGLGLRGRFLLRGPQQPEPQGSLRLALGGSLQLALGGWLLGAAPLLGGDRGGWHLGVGRWGRHNYLGGSSSPEIEPRRACAAWAASFCSSVAICKF